MRAFVTGGTGFLGRRVVQRLLDRGDELVVLVRDPDKACVPFGDRIEVVHCNLTAIDAALDRIAGCDIVYHIGARVESGGDWEEFRQANIIATDKLLNAAFRHGVRRFVHVSSLGIFDIPETCVTITEDSPYDVRPLQRGHYTRSKIGADRIACAAARTGMPVVIVRPGLIYGRDHPQQPIFLGRVYKRLGRLGLVVISRPSYRPPLIYVENAADAVVQAGTAEGVEGRVFNVVDDPDLTERTYYHAIADLPGCPSRVFYLPVGLFAPGVRTLDFLFRILKRRPWSVAYQLLRSGRSVRYSTDAARTDLGWAPRVSLRASLVATVNPQH